MALCVYVNYYIYICNMDLEEVIKELRSKSKVYIGIMPQPNFSQTLISIENGIAKDSTIVAFMEKFGYEIENERTWKKKN